MSASSSGCVGTKKRLEKDLGPTSIRLVWATLSGVLQAAVEDRRLARNPCRASTVRPPAATPGRVEAWQPERVLAVRAAPAERYRVLVERTKLCFALPKVRKVRDVPLPASVAKAIRQHREVFAPVPVTMPWDDPRSTGTTSIPTSGSRPWPGQA